LTPFFEIRSGSPRPRADLSHAAIESALVMDGMAEPSACAARQGRPLSAAPAGSLVVVLGDLGCLASDADEAAARWAAFGRRLEGPVAALSRSRPARRRVGFPRSCGLDHGRLEPACPFHLGFRCARV